MPNFSSTSEILVLPKPHEKSSLTSFRDTDSINVLWAYIAKMTDVVNKLSKNDVQQNRDIKRVGERKVLDLDLYPFKIYNMPSFFSTASFPDPGWRNYQIRGGYCFPLYVTNTGSYVNGTDRMERFSSENILQQPAYYGSYTAPTGSSQYYIWIEQTGSTSLSSLGSSSSFYIRASSTPQTPDGLYNPTGWSNWPTQSYGKYWLLGWIDTLTSASVYRMFIHQCWTAGDILWPYTTTASVCDNNDVFTTYKIVGTPTS